MAKEKTNLHDFGLTLIRKSYPKKNQNGEKIVNSKGEEIIVTTLILPMELLGKKINFRITANSEDELNTVKDWFDLHGEDCNKLPVKIEEQESYDDRLQKKIVRNYVYVQYDVNDDIHVIRLLPSPTEKTNFNMAVAEALAVQKKKWSCPESVRKIRKERYDAAKAAREKDLQETAEPENDPGKGKKQNKKGSKQESDLDENGLPEFPF